MVQVTVRAMKYNETDSINSSLVQRIKKPRVYLANTQLILDSILCRYYFLRETDNRIIVSIYCERPCVLYRKEIEMCYHWFSRVFRTREHLLRYLKKRAVRIIILILISINIK